MKDQNHMNLHDSPRTQLILQSAIPNMLYRLAAPNMLAVIIISIVTFSEAWYVGKVNTVALAGLAIVFPFQTLMGMMGNGGMGNGTASALSRSIGKNDFKRAHSVIWHSALVNLFISLVYLIALGIFSRSIFNLFGASEEVTDQAVLYARIFFGLAPFIWLYFWMKSVLRGLGAIQIMARLDIVASVIQLVLSGALTLGWFFLPSLGLVGPAIAAVLCQGFAGVAMLILFVSGKFEISLKIIPLDFDVTKDILKVGGMGVLLAFNIALTIMLTTRFVADFGTEAIAGYGVCGRLEQMLIPLAFGVGGVLVVIVGTNFGASQYERARKSARFGALIIALVATLIGVILALFPSLWIDLFIKELGAFAIGSVYLRIVGPVFGLFAGGQTLSFASYGTGNMIIPVFGGVYRVLITSIFGLSVSYFSLDISLLFWGVSIGMVGWAIILSLNMISKVWNPEKTID
ncbi:MAG: MATE family efflux transporter [Dehalococcoidia bacterium]